MAKAKRLPSSSKFGSFQQPFVKGPPKDDFSKLLDHDYMMMSSQSYISSDSHVTCPWIQIKSFDSTQHAHRCTVVPDDASLSALLAYLSSFDQVDCDGRNLDGNWTDRDSDYLIQSTVKLDDNPSIYI